MTLGLIRGLITLALFVSFIALVFWAWSKHRKADFEAAARLPLEDGSAPPFPAEHLASVSEKTPSIDERNRS